MKYLKIKHRLLVSFISFTVLKKSSENEKKKTQKNAENDKSPGYFQSFFLSFFSSPRP